MVNFRQWALLLTVGVLNIRAEAEEQPQCIFTVDSGKLTGVSTCSDKLYGYHYLKDNVLVSTTGDTANLNDPVFIKVTGSNSYVEVDLPGYYKNFDNTFVICKGGSTPCENYPIPSNPEPCPLGKYLSQGVVIGCNNGNPVYKNFAQPEVPKNKRSDSEPREYYLSQYSKDGPFGFDANVPYYAIKIDETSITFDETVDLNDVMLDLSTGKVITNRKEDFCSANSGKHFYSCTNGKCIRRSQTDYNTIVPNEGLCTIIDKKVTESDRTITFLASEECEVNSGYYIGKEINKDGEVKEVLCKIDGIHTDCSEPKEIARGYYWNDVYYNGIIRCDEHHCEQFKPTIATECNSELANQIIDTGYSVYYCMNDNDNIKKVTLEVMAHNILENDDTQIAGHSGSIFDNPDAYYHLDSDEHSIKVDLSKNEMENGIQCVKGTCVQTMCTVTVSASGCIPANCGSTSYDGYQFLDVESKPLDNDQNVGFFIKLENGVCTLVTKTNGFYLNQIEGLKDEYPLIYCTDKGCRLKKRTMLDVYNLPNGDEYDNYIEYYYLNQEDTHNKPIITCWESEFTEIDIECRAGPAKRNFYINGSQNYYSVTRTVIACTRSLTDETVTCIEKEMSGNEHYPIMDINGKNVLGVMKCDGDECHEEEERNNIYGFQINNIKKIVEVTPNEDYVVINGLEKTKLIHCNYYKDNCNIIRGNKGVDVNDNTLYYIDSSADESTLGLIKCAPNNADCVHVVGTERLAYISGIENKVIICEYNRCSYYNLNDGYYLNGDDLNGSERKPLIYYEAIKGTLVTKNADRKDQIFKNNGAVYGYNLILCSAINSCIDIKTDPGKMYLSYLDNHIYSYNGESVPMTIESYENKGILVSPDNFEILTDNSIEGKLITCIKDNKGTDNPSDDVLSCTEISSSTNQYYINGGPNSYYKLIQSKDSKYKLISADTGFYINSVSNIIDCNVVVPGVCSIYTTKDEEILKDGKCINGKVGYITSNGTICVKDGEAPISIDQGKYLLSKYQNSEVLFNFESSKVTLVPKNGNKIYLVINNGKVVTSSESGNLYECTYSTDKYVCQSKQSTTTAKYYINGDDSTNLTYPKIKCEGTSGVTCNLQTDASNEIYCVSGNNLYQCSKDVTGKCPEANVIGQSCINIVEPKNMYYLNESDNVSLIKCINNSCSKEIITKEGYYLSGNPSKPLIKCIKSFDKVRCIYETTPIKNGYYVNIVINNYEKNVLQFNKRGSINIITDPNLIKCDAKGCEDVHNIYEGWYLSSDNLIILCKGNVCQKQLKPTEGWYVNGNGMNEDGKYLIKCTVNKVSKGDLSYSCAESKIIKEGYYINAAYGENEDKKLIKCTKRECSTENGNDTKYYVNGVDEKLIYCTKYSCTATVPSSNSYTTWYLTNDGDALIGCNKSGICKKYENPSQSGYYMNGDPNTSKYPLITYDTGFVTTNDYLDNGWYRNGDLNASRAEMVIRCDNANSCVYIEVQERTCEEINDTGFTISKGYLEWCNTDQTGFKLEESSSYREKIVTAIFKEDDKIPGVKLIGVKGEHYALTDISLDYIEKIRGEQHALIKIYQNRVVSYKESDGYYRYQNELYECEKYNNGVCLKVEEIKDGYYRNYGIEIVYECNSNEYNLCKTIRDSDEYKFGFMKNLGEYIENLENNRLAAFDVKGKDFPGVNANIDYILAEVNKYAVKYKENIDVKCTAVNNQQVNMNCENKLIEYDYETDNGYFIFNDKSRLSYIYIPKVNETHEYKLYCKIDGLCLEKEKSITAITNYRLSDDKVLLAEKKGSDSKDVIPLVLDGVYISKKSEGNYVKIVCRLTGECEEHQIRTNNGEGISITNNGVIKFTPEGKSQIEASKLYSKYVLKKSTVSGRNGRRDEIPDEEYPMDTVLELKYNSYTWERGERGTRNIFVNNDYAMITTEYTNVNTGYICKNGNCYEVPKSSNKNYYINTVQLGSNINAYVECSNKCELKSLSEHNEVVLVPNGAANGREDALIYCRLDKGCEVIAETAESGLSNCKLESYANPIYHIKARYDNGSLYRESGEKLSDYQYCLHNGVPKNLNVNDNDDINNELYMFDEGMENVNIGQVNRDYINASLYYCYNKICSRTYGYLSLNNGYARCDKTGCKVINESGSCTLNGAGSMNNKDNICISNNDADSVKGESNDIKFYPVSIDNEGSFPEVNIASKIIVGVKDKYKFVLNVDGYVLITKTNTIGYKNNEEGKLYKCTAENLNCVEVVTPEDGVYMNVFKIGDNMNIECNSGSCIINKNNLVYSNEKTFALTDINEYYYVNDYLYKSTKREFTKMKINGYILLKNNRIAGDFPERASNLYLCNSSIEKCTKVSPKEDGWYISYSGNGNAIYCENTLCYNKVLTNQCTEVGEMVYQNNNYYLCKDKRNHEANSVDEMLGKIVKIESSGYFGGSDYINYGISKVVAVGKSSLSSTDTTNDKYMPLTVCGMTDKCRDIKNNEYCIYNDSILYQRTEESNNDNGDVNVSCQQKEGLVVLYGNKELYTFTENKKLGAKMYYCVKSPTPNCRIVTGYFDDISCDYDGCKKAITGNGNGDWNEKGKIIVGSSPKLAEEGKYYYITGENNFPGSGNKEGFIIQSGVQKVSNVDKKYFIIFKGEGYYLLSSSTEKMLEKDDEAVPNGYLYYCSENNLVCIQQTKAENGYYRNAKAERGKGVITCRRNGDSSVCKIASQAYDNIGEVVETDGNSFNCTESNVGRLVRDKAKTRYQICYGSNMIREFTANAQTTQYYFMTMKHGNKFAGVELTSVGEKYTNDTATLLLKITNLSITQVNVDGYILSSSNTILENVSKTTNGNLYYCEDKAYETQGISKTHQCAEVKERKSGLYFTSLFNDNRYIKCTESQCNVAEAIYSNDCIGSGSLVYNGGKLKICETEGKQVEVEKLKGVEAVMMNVQKSTEFPSVRNDNTDIVVNRSAQNVTLVKMDSYVVAKEGLKVKRTVVSLGLNRPINEESEKGALYKCENTGSCEKVQYSKDEWYLYGVSGAANQLIYCINRKCSVRNPVEGFYISANKLKPVIQCIQPGNVKATGELIIEEGKEKEKIVCFERNPVEGWFVNKADDGLIRCTDEMGCERFDVANGWYLNAGANYSYEKLTNRTVADIIRCGRDGRCGLYESEIKTSCTKGGEVVKVNNSYKVCKSTDANDYIDFNIESVEIIEVAARDDFPDAESGKTAVSVKKEKIVQASEDGYYYKNNSMFNCKDKRCTEIMDNESNEIVVLNVLSKTLYLASCTDNTCSWSEQTDEGYYFVQNRDGKTYFYTNDGDKLFSNIEIYYCRSKNRQFKCSNVTRYDGYMYNPNHMVEGRKSNENLYLKSGSTYKLVSTKLRKCTEYKPNYCYISYENEPYARDVENYDSTTDLPKDITAGSICVNANGIMYFATKTIDTGIDEKNCVEIPHGNDNSFSYQKINVGKPDEKVYLVDSYGARVAEEDYVYEGPSCTYDIKTGFCKAVGIDEIKAGEFCKTTAGMDILYLARARITNVGNVCVRYNSNNNDYVPDDNVTRDKSKQYYLINSSVYTIDGKKVEKMKEGIYYTDVVNYRVSLNSGYTVSIEENSDYIMYVCNKEGCERKIKCNIKNGYEYLYNNENQKVVKCDPLTNTITEIDTPGYYVNSISKDLIKCYDDGTCLENTSDTAMEGYYKDMGNPEKMIKCVRNEDDLRCTEEKIVECKYEESKGTCTSTEDLLRNSYCYYRKEDKVYGIIWKYIYISKFIKSGTEGKCIAGTEVDVFVKERNSKFLGHEEREDLIRVGIDSIVSVYEKDIGYYLIDTKEGKGVIPGVNYGGLIPEKKTRFYVCRNNLCEEEVPESNKIYVNKASSKKLVKYIGGIGPNNGQWKVIDNGCKMHRVNTVICDIDPPSYVKTIDQYSIVFKDQYDAVTLYDNVSRVKGKIRLDYHEKLKSNTFIEYENDLYLYDIDGQSFSKQEGGPYVFEKPKYEKYNFNLVAYRSNRNETKIEYLVLPNEYKLGDEGYYINKADMDGIGIVIQMMKIEQKLEPAFEAEEGIKTAQQDVSIPEIIDKYKAVINKCTSEKKNVCKTAEGTDDIEQGGPCVVTEGEFKGLYLAVESIKKNSEGRNCIKYEEGGSYKYLDKEVLFSGQRMKNNIIKVSKDKIEPFRHDISNDDGYESGIYVFTETEDKNLIKFNNNTFESAVSYKCGKKIVPAVEEGDEEEISYACELFNGESGYYLTKPLGNYANPVDVMEYKTKKWRNVNELGYYFFKENYFPANISYAEAGEVVIYHPVIYDYRRVFGGVSIDNKGRYLNKVDSSILVDYDSESNDEYKLTINKELKKCVVDLVNGTCTNESKNLDVDDACIGQDGKLYVVDVIKGEVPEEDVAKCYSGSVDHLKYVLINDKSLYMLDGMSIKNMGKGYYVLNESMEAFTSKYPEIASMIVYCNDVDQCKKVTEKLDVNQDVLISEAKSDIFSRRSLLRYYADEFGKERFMMINKNGYYCLNEDGSLNVNDIGDIDDAVNCWMKDDNGISEGNGCDYNDICINSAKSSGNIVITNGKSKKINGIVINYEKGYIQLNKDYNLDNNKVIYKMFDGKLYKLKKEKLEHVEEGLYLLSKDGKAFVETEPTLIENKLICYYVNGACNADEMMKYRKHKYVINRAANPPTIVTFDKDKWATVDKDGYYFFFALNNGQPYSVDLEDRRVYTNESEVRVKRIVDGKILEDEDFNNGMYVTDDRNEELVVGRVDGSWYDAEYVISNVEGISRRRCSAIETGEKIDVDEYCYSDKYGICMPKSTITDTTVNEANCISSKNKENYFYFISNGLYIANNYSYQRIVHNGLYVIDNENLPFSGKMESESTAYLCEEGLCNNVKEFESTYYLNVAGLEVGENIILYFNSESNSWRTVDADGNYLFNKYGYPVSADEEIKYYYKVSKNGNVLERKDVIGNKVVSKDGSVYSGPDGKAKILETCSVDGTVVTADAVLEVGDLCVADGVVVIITGVDKSTKRQEGSNVTYSGITGSADGKKYALVGNELVIIDLDVITTLNVNGYVIVDDGSMLPLESRDETVATVFKCDVTGCVVVDSSEFEEGKNYINNGNKDKYPLVEYVSEGKWKVEDSEGYYFLDDTMKGVKEGVFAETIYEVKVVNDELKQKDITGDNIVGFFMNKASDKKNVVSNNNKFWSEGKKLNKCIVSEVKTEGVVTGMLCKTDNVNYKGYPAGDYCISGKNDQLYYLLQPANNETTAANCVYGSSENAKYVYLDRNNGGWLNGIKLTNSLLKVDQDAIRETENGYYILNNENLMVKEVLPVTEEGQTQGYNIYKCEDSGCTKKELASGVVFQTVDGKVHEIDEVGNIGNVKKNGLYFFDNDGDICDKDNTEVGSIINVEKDEERTIEVKVPLDSMREGAFINEGNGIYVGVYENGQWSIVDMECEVDLTDGKCSSTKVDLELGSYCSVAGKFYVVSSIDADGARRCIAGNNESPVFINTDNDRLVVVGEKLVFSINEEEGYYAINDETLQGLESEEPVKAQFVLCEFGGECKKYTPEVGRYINRSTGELNIAVYEEAGKSEASTIESKCTVEENVTSAVCNVVNGTLDIGDVCINENMIYVISSSNGTCLKAEKAVITYQIINDKMYMLTEDAVIQKNDGYFFINGDNRAITKKEDYSKPDTVGYICSNKGDCYDIDPTERAYYTDYTTKSSKRYNVVKFDPELKTARKGKREGNSGYEAVNEEGIYKLADGAYSECIMNDIDVIECHDIQEVGSYITNEGELVKCVENEEGEIECSQAIEGGYYVINGKLMECEVNEDGDKLVCNEMDKEGYFIAQPEGELWECVEKSEVEQAAIPEEDEDMEVSKVLDKLNAEAGNAGEDSVEETSDAFTETTTTEAETTTTTFEEYTPTPVAVECAPIECKLGKVIYQKDENGVEIENSPIYVCKSVKDGENRFETECDSGNYIKGKNGYYICEADKSDIEEGKIDKPNDDHTKDVIPEKTTTSTTTTTTTTTKSEETQTTTKTTAKPQTTAVKPTSSPTTAGAQSLYRKLPTLTFYLVIFVFSYFLFF